MGLDNPLHIAFLVIILLLVFGARRLPEIGRSLGSGMREFKQGISGDSSPSQQQQQAATPALPAGQQQAPIGAAQQQQAVPADGPVTEPPPQQAAPVEPQHH
jgi:sec-independent protein translocase protein TatA